jgi:hypothetical protein
MLLQDKIVEFILSKQCQVSPFTINTFFSDHGNVLPLVDNHPLVKKNRLGYYIHIFIVLLESLVAQLQTTTTVNLNKFTDHTLFIGYITDNAKDCNVFVYFNSKHTKMYVKLQTVYNIYNTQSLLDCAKQSGMAGLCIENVYAEYDTAYSDVNTLVDKNILLRTKTRLYFAALAIPNI